MRGEHDDERPVRIVIIDDSVDFQRYAKRFLENESGVSVVGVASTGSAGLMLVRRHGPDVVLLDLSLPDCSGLSIIADLKAAAAGVRVIIVSVSEAATHEGEALRSGADAYVEKAHAARRLPALIRGGPR